MENKRKFDSKFIGAGVFAIFFTGIGIFDFITENNSYFITLGIGILSFLYLIYLLKRTRGNLNERYEDERKKFISEKSSSFSYSVLISVILVLIFLVSNGKIAISSSTALCIVLISALIIQPVAYLICKYKY